MSDVVLCKDCIHCSASWWARYKQDEMQFECNHPSRSSMDLVTGKVRVLVPVKCKIARLDRPNIAIRGKECGQEGKLWTPKNKKDLFVLLKR